MEKKREYPKTMEKLQKVIYIMQITEEERTKKKNYLN